MSSGKVSPPPVQENAAGLMEGVQGAQTSINSFGAQPYYGMQGMSQAYPNMMSGLGASGYDPAGATGAANSIYGASQGIPGMANAVWNQAQDPQNAMYNQMMHGADASAMAGLSGSGVADTPYGASVRGTMQNNAQMMWDQYRNQQLQQGANSAAGLLGQFGQMQGLGAQTAGMAPQQQEALLASLVGQGNAALSPYAQQVQNYLGLGGLGEQSYSNLMSGYGTQQQAKAQQNQSSQSGMQGMGQMAGMAAMMMMSDRRMKDDVTRLGELKDGTPVYSFRYKGGSDYFVGVMAQDILHSHPDAVHDIGGVYYVDYSKLEGL